MLTRILRTPDEKNLTMARVLLGALFFVRGAQGLLGWFGGSGIHDLSSFVHLVSLPAPLVLLTVFIDFFGGIVLIAGLFARISAAFILADTASTLVLWAISPRVFMDWSITQGGAGIQYFLLALAVALILVARGAGAFSLDRMLLGRKRRRAALRIASTHDVLHDVRRFGENRRGSRPAGGDSGRATPSVGSSACRAWHE
jgi:putative oxidoreductase